jgi:hypothetical protein
VRLEAVSSQARGLVSILSSSKLRHETLTVATVAQRRCFGFNARLSECWLIHCLVVPCVEVHGQPVLVG